MKKVTHQREFTSMTEVKTVGVICTKKQITLDSFLKND